jgi:hypothetical protein
MQICEFVISDFVNAGENGATASWSRRVFLGRRALVSHQGITEKHSVALSL